jgi:hypothetical protein
MIDFIFDQALRQLFAKHATNGLGQKMIRKSRGRQFRLSLLATAKALDFTITGTRNPSCVNMYA